MFIKLAPIALFVYNRPLHTKKTIDALLTNNLASETELYIFSDGPKNSKKIDKQLEDLRSYIKIINGFKNITIIEREKNYGLGQNIIAGVTEILKDYEKIIVLEDDMITSPYFLTFMNEALNMYENIEEVISISGYVYPLKTILPETFFIQGADCWGWATWRNRWQYFESNGEILLKKLLEQNLTKKFDFNGSYPYVRMLKNQIRGNNSSWAIRWYATAFIEKKLTLYPFQSLVMNIGNDGSGTNTIKGKSFDTILLNRQINLKLIHCKENEIARKAFEDYFKLTKLTYSTLIVNKIKKILKHLI